MNKSRIVRTIIYTLGHIMIAVTCNTIITGAQMHLALTDAIIEPMINGLWFYALDWTWNNHFNNK